MELSSYLIPLKKKKIPGTLRTLTSEAKLV